MDKTRKHPEREIWLDWVRVTACFLVMVVHSAEPFYLGGEGSLILTKTDAVWVALLDSLARACVPLFVVVSAWLQFPVRHGTAAFFRRRAVRILIPFVLWTLVYALVWGEPVQNFKDLLLNVNYAAGHLWFVYMLVGIYLLLPLLSPWAEKVSRKELQFYLGIWLFTTLIPFLRDSFGGTPLIITGPSGLPRQALYPLWGEASWNAYGTFYYFSGFIGYLMLGLYLRRFAGECSWRRTLGIALPCFLAGLAVSAGGFLRRVFAACGGVFPAEGSLAQAVRWETTWCNDTLGVALMTLAWLLVFRKITHESAGYRNVVLPVSKASYGMYLGHMLLLAPFSAFFRSWLGTGTEGRLCSLTTPAEILLTAACSFFCAALAAILLRRIPKIGKYLVG